MLNLTNKAPPKWCSCDSIENLKTRLTTPLVSGHANIAGVWWNEIQHQIKQKLSDFFFLQKTSQESKKNEDGMASLKM